MNYELAKKLKDAGFPFDFGAIHSMDMYPPILGYQNYPTLSELIEACGEGFSHLVLDEGQWGCYGYEGEDKHTPFICGESPEEAVANLWLELNKK